MKKQYRLDSGMDTSITLEVDTDQLDEATAAEINGFWNGDDDVMERSGGDVYQAVARRAAGPLLTLLICGYSENGAVEELNSREGWPGAKVRWLRIIDSEIPDLDATEFSVAEIARPASA